MPDETTPVVGDGIVDIGGENMADVMESANLQIALTVLGQEFGAAAGRRVNSSDQLSGDSQRMWAIAMTTPTVMAGLGFRTATESGSGRTRAETNRPEETSAAKPA